MGRGKEAGYPTPPPHRSLRAELPHKAPTSGSDVQALFGIRVIVSHRWKPFRSQTAHPLSSNLASSAPSPKRFKPETVHVILESVEFSLVAWYAEILEVSL